MMELNLCQKVKELLSPTPIIYEAIFKAFPVAV